MDVGERAELPLEAVEGVGLGVQEGLEGDDLVALAVVGLVDDAHAAGAEATPDAKARAAERMGPEQVHRQPGG